MGFHIYTDHWWRNPKHAVTTTATLVEVQRPERPTGTITSGPYNPSPSGHFQSVVADVTDPATGEVVRATGELYFSWGSFAVGQTIKVRWSAKRKAIELYTANTAPEGEWDGAGGGGGATLLSGTGLSGDQSARVQQALGALGINADAGVQVVRLQDAGPEAGHPDPIDMLERLVQLRQAGALTDEEFEQQKHRILNP